MEVQQARPSPSIHDEHHRPSTRASSNDFGREDEHRRRRTPPQVHGQRHHHQGERTHYGNWCECNYKNTWFLTFLGTTWAGFERHFTLELDQCSKFNNSPKLSTNQDSYGSPCIVKLNQNKRKEEQELKLDRIKKLATEPKKKQRTKLENRM